MRGLRILAFLALPATLALAARPAAATPVTHDPGTLTASGEARAIYVFSDAGDTSLLGLVGTPETDLFRNHAAEGEAASAAGDTVDLGFRQGPLVFQLEDLSTGTTFRTDLADAVDGAYHAIYASDYATLGAGALPTAAARAIAALPTGTRVTYIAFEDRRFGDYDYNDLIFALADIPAARPAAPGPRPVPEPGSLPLLAAALAAAFAGRGSHTVLHKF